MYMKEEEEEKGEALVLQPLLPDPLPMVLRGPALLIRL
jgi:hypothetical protein